MVLLVLVLYLGLIEAQPTCDDVPSCRTAALEAKDRKDFEAFHDLAWLTYRKGKPDDPELMLLLARAQSLSGRPGDAIVMLERLAARGIATDAATSEDFESVRALPRWSGVASTREATVAPSGEAKSASPSAAAPAPGREANPAPGRGAKPAPAGGAKGPPPPSRTPPRPASGRGPAG